MAYKKKQTFFPTEPQPIDERASSVPNVKVPLKGRSPRQRFYIKELEHGETPFIVAYGPAGTGKTMPAAIHAINELCAGNIKKIIITRPLVTMDEEELGFLPGTLVEKASPFLIPLLDIFEEHLGAMKLRSLMENNIIEVAPLAFMRGRTIANCLVIFDEAQNASPKQCLSLLTRIGDNARIIITGDVEQTDRTTGQNGLRDMLTRIERTGNPNFSVYEFERSDVVRHPAIESILEMYD